jgi:protein-tyrosine phosphatase
MTDAPLPKVLCVCTGNLCRSVCMAFLLGKAWKDDAIVDSAGTYAMEGWEILEDTRTLLADEKLDASNHEPRQLTDKDLKEADLVLVAASDHKAWISQKLGAMPPNVFLLTEAAALTVFALRPPSADRSERIRLAAPALDAARTQLSEIRQPNILDPTGLSRSAHEKVLEQCKAAIETLTAWIG